MNRRHLLALAAAGALPVEAADVSRKPRLRTALCAYSYRDALKARTMTYQDLVQLAVEFDVDGLDLTTYWFPSTDDSFVLPLRNLAYRNAVSLYSIAIRTVMTRATEAERAKEIAEIRRWVDVAQKLGAGHIRVFGGDVPEGATEEQAVPWVVETLKRAAQYAGSKGVILGLENHGGITGRAPRIIQIIKAVNSPWVGINVDTGNFSEEVFEQIGMCMPHAVNIQLKTEMRGPDGALMAQDWAKTIGMVKRNGYKGYLSIEYEGSEDVNAAMPRLVKTLQGLLA